MNLVPMVIENSPNGGERVFDIQSRMLRDRIVFLNGPINTEMSNLIVAQLLYLESESSTLPITLIIHSTGGCVNSGLFIYDCMKFLKNKISTISGGQVCSMGSLLAQSGAAGERSILPNCRTMIHSVSSGSQGTVIDMKIQLEESLRLNKVLTQIYVDHNSKGKTYEDFEAAMSRDFFLSAQEAVDFGLADKIITNRI